MRSIEHQAQKYIGQPRKSNFLIHLGHDRLRRILCRREKVRRCLLYKLSCSPNAAENFQTSIRQWFARRQAHRQSRLKSRATWGPYATDSLARQAADGADSWVHGAVDNSRLGIL